MYEMSFDRLSDDLRSFIDAVHVKFLRGVYPRESWYSRVRRWF